MHIERTYIANRDMTPFHSTFINSDQIEIFSHWKSMARLGLHKSRAFSKQLQLLVLERAALKVVSVPSFPHIDTLLSNPLTTLAKS